MAREEKIFSAEELAGWARSCQLAANTTGMRGAELLMVRDALSQAARDRAKVEAWERTAQRAYDEHEAVGGFEEGEID